MMRKLLEYSAQWSLISHFLFMTRSVSNNSIFRYYPGNFCSNWTLTKFVIMFWIQNFRVVNSDDSDSRYSTSKWLTYHNSRFYWSSTVLTADQEFYSLLFSRIFFRLVFREKFHFLKLRHMICHISFPIILSIIMMLNSSSSK